MNSPSSWSPTCDAATASCGTRGAASPPAVTSSKTTVTELVGVGPIVAATVIGDVDDVSLHQS
jgi:hypothetical protein